MTPPFPTDTGQSYFEQAMATMTTAAALFDLIRPAEILESWDRQEATMPFTDPTSYQKILAARDDMGRKRRLLQAAADYLRQWNAVRDEVLAQEKSP